MRFVSSVTAAKSVDLAIRELLAPIDARLTPGAADLVFVFISAQYGEETEVIVDRISAMFPNAILMGCTAEGTIGVDRELERMPSISLIAAELPDVNINPFHINQTQLAAADDESDWERLVAVSSESKPVFIALADPFRVDIHSFIESINAFYPDAPLVGGVASAASAPRENRLICRGEIHREGIVGIALTGNVVVNTVVSQGCRPIGKPFVITKGEKHIIRELGGRIALEQLHNVLESLSPEDDALARQSLLIGRVIDEYKDRFTRGDFLIHNIIGVDRKTGAIGMAGHAKTGATVQFHVRDAESADQDLRMMLSPHAGNELQGAMLFGCNGRGTHMWPTAGHDIGVIRELCGDVPTAGFFCGGEFGPIGGKNFVHGFTASIALFLEPKKT